MKLSLFTTTAFFSIPSDALTLFHPPTFGVRHIISMKSHVGKSMDEALSASKLYGKKSEEAKMAWDSVEDDNSIHYSDQSMVKKSIDTKEEYIRMLTNLDFLMKEYGGEIGQLHILSKKVKQYEKEHPELLNKQFADSAEKLLLLRRAKGIAEEFGTESIHDLVAREESEELCNLLEEEEFETKDMSCVDYMMLKLT